LHIGWSNALDYAEAEQSMKKSERYAVTVFRTKEHLSKVIDDHLLKEDEIDDQVKVARVMQKLMDSVSGFPQKPWHDWDEWVRGLE
jgi:hypothetical protein